MWFILGLDGTNIVNHLHGSFLLGTKTCELQQPTLTHEGIRLALMKMVYLIKKKYINASIYILLIAIENLVY